MTTPMTSTSAEPEPKRALPRPPWRSIAILIPFIAVFVALAVGNPYFLTPLNLLNIFERQSGTLIIGAAMTLVLIAGGIDLSVGATYMLASAICASLVVSVGTVPGIILGLLAGVIVGAVNGVVSTYLRINPLIATLAMSFIISGVTSVVVAGRLFILSGHPDFTAIAQAPFLGISSAIWIALVVVVIIGVLLARTTVGRYLYSAGGNAEAARLAGIRVNGVRILAFTISGLAAALAGIIDTSRTSGVPTTSTVATTLTFTVLAGVVVGGTSILGGEGAVWRTVVGILFIALVYNGFNLLRIDPLYQQIALGVILLLAVGIDAWSRVLGSSGLRRARRAG